MNIVHTIVNFLEGKKAIIASIVNLVISYLVTDGTISAPFGTMLASLIGLLTTTSLAVGASQSYKSYQLGKGIAPANPTI